VKRIALIAALKPDAYARAQEILKGGPPFNLEAGTFERHSVFVSRQEVVFVFESAEVEWRLDDLISDFFQSKLQDTFAEWRPLIAGKPRIAREAFFWQKPLPAN
jgi:hypothetical protein